MSSEIAIKVDGVSKCYHIYDNPRDRLFQMLARGRKQYFREFWALHDVSFEIGRGETIGIVGRNGSGKSTLLQCICGTLNMTGGRIDARGRIAALLELGSGFNPEFTGRENVYMNAAVLGLSRGETDARFAEIEAFADIGSFIDQPTKMYSSGMVVRLAFAVAINADASILIVDEALAVGDELFQRKCFAKIEAIKKAGATILFVSHSGGVVIELCDRAILLDGGRKLAEGIPKQIVGQYQKLLYAPADKVAAIRDEILAGQGGGVPQDGLEDEGRDYSGTPDSDGTPAAVEDDLEFFDPHLVSTSVLAYESHGVYIDSPRLFLPSGTQVNCLRRGRLYRYGYDASFDVEAGAVRFGMMIKTLSGLELGGAASAASSQSAIAYIPAGSRVRVNFDFECNLNPGTYYLNAGVVGSVGGEETYLHRLVDGCLFRVIPESDDKATGVVDFKCMPNVTFLSIDSKSKI